MKTILGMTLVFLYVSASAQSRLNTPGGETFEQLAELTGSQPLALSSNSVAIGGNTLVIGAAVANSGNCFECGAAYVYTAVDGDWTNLTLTATLTQFPGQGTTYGGFGQSVAISGNTIVVGGTAQLYGGGAAYVYISPSGTVTENAELTTSGSTTSVGPLSVSIDGNIIVAGSNLAQVGNEKEFGAAYVYVEPAGGWTDMTQNATLVATDESADALFGTYVGISGSTVVVGAPDAEVNAIRDRGLAYLYVEPKGGWSGTLGQTTELDPSNGTRDAAFGVVSISGNTVAVGASGQSVGSNGGQGAVYIFSRPSTAGLRL